LQPGVEFQLHATGLLGLRHLEFDFGRADRLAAQRADFPATVTTPDALRMHPRQPSACQALTRGAMKVKFPGHNLVGPPFPIQSTAPWAFRRAAVRLVPPRRVTKCNQVIKM